MAFATEIWRVVRLDDELELYLGNDWAYRRAELTAVKMATMKD